MAREAAERPPEETLSLWKREQARLKALVVDRDTEAWQRDPAFSGLQRVGGVDVSFVKGDSVGACASLVVLSYPELEVVYEDCQMVSLTAPYVSGFLAFREVPFLVDAVRRLREQEPGLMPQAGPPCGWKRASPPPRLWRGLPPRRPHRPAVHRGGQEAPAGRRAGEQRPAQGEGPEEPRPQHQAALCLCGPQDQPGGGRAPDPRPLQVPDPGARAPGGQWPVKYLGQFPGGQGLYVCPRGEPAASWACPPEGEKQLPVPGARSPHPHSGNGGRALSCRPPVSSPHPCSSWAVGLSALHSLEHFWKPLGKVTLQSFP
ncbi:endonuclease V isoform X2 [Crocuta crocuta]